MLLVQSHPAKIIIIKCILQGCNYSTRMGNAQSLVVDRLKKKLASFMDLWLERSSAKHVRLGLILSWAVRYKDCKKWICCSSCFNAQHLRVVHQCAFHKHRAKVLWCTTETTWRGGIN